jgi:hypothetical protein
MARADIAIATPNSTTQRSSQSSYLVKTSGGVIYALFISGVDNVLYWVKSSDGGFSWTNPATVKGIGASSSGWAVWYDAWTPGDSGTLIHIWTFDTTADDVTWRTLDTSSDTLSSEVVVFAGATTGGAANTCISGTKAIGGNLYVAFDIDGGTETGFYRSVDAGANWTARTDVNEATPDYYYLAPGFAADTQDILCIFWDRSASEITRKVYDDSANSWAETSIAVDMNQIATSNPAPQFAIAIDDANNKILLAAWTRQDVANADLRFWTVDETTITEKTNVVQDSGDDQGMVAVGLATDTATIYAYYGGKSDGSETFATAINIYYKESTDSGTTWGAETQLTVLNKGYDYLMTFPVFTGDFGAMFLAQTTTIDTLLYSALLPDAGGGGGNEMAAPIFGGAIVR